MLALRRRARAYGAEVGPGLRLGEVHGPGPFPLTSFGSSSACNAGVAATSSASTAPRESCGQSMKARLEPNQISSTATATRQRRTLAAERRRRTELRPAGGDEFRVGSAKFGRHAHDAVLEQRTARIAEHIDRRQHLFPEARGLLEDRVCELARELSVARKGGQLLHAQQLAEYESLIFERCVIHEYDKSSEPARMAERERCHAALRHPLAPL